MEEEKLKETFFNLFPLYTRHTVEKDGAKASYSTFLFGLANIARFQDSKEEAYSVCLFEPLRWIGMKLDGEDYIDSLDELTKDIYKDRDNIKKVKFRW